MKIKMSDAYVSNRISAIEYRIHCLIGEKTMAQKIYTILGTTHKPYVDDFVAIVDREYRSLYCELSGLKAGIAV